MQWLVQPNGKRGRNQRYSDAAIQFCLSIKAMFGLALRQSLGFVQSLLKLTQLDWPVPNISTVCRRQASLQVALTYRPSSGGLHLLVDSTGIKFLGEGEWKRKKHGAEYRRQWRKVHLGIDAQTLEIRAVEVTDNSVGDAPVLPELLPTFQPMSRWPASALMVPMTPGPATTRLQHAGPKPSFHLGAMPRFGSLHRLEQPAATRPLGPASALAGPFGSSGVATTAAAL